MPKRPATNNNDKLQKKFIQEQQKRIRPGECQKYIRVVIDEDLLRLKAVSSLISKLTDETTNHVIRQQMCPKTITWERNVGQQIFNQTDDNPLCNLSDKYELENQVLRVFSIEEFNKTIENKTIHEEIKRIKINCPEMKITLVVDGVDGKQRNTKKQVEWEEGLVELQILYECSIYFLSSPTELSYLVLRFTKAVAEIPYKKQRSLTLLGSSQFLLNDNKDCVQVEGNVGLGRLWQQHLNRLPLVTLDVAQTIINKHPCPKSLLDELKADGPTSLASLKISRGPVPLAAERQIGEVLSKKLYALYNSMDPNEVL